MARLLILYFFLMYCLIIIMLFTYPITMSESSNENNIIIGKWTKISKTVSSQSECSSKYPDNIEFKSGGIYRGFKGIDKNEFTIWDVGSYKLLSKDQIKISTANDAQIAYTFSIKDNILYFLDKEKCQFQYQKDL